MTTPWRNIVVALSIATVLAFITIVPTIRGVSTWKYVLAVIGLTLFFLAGREKSKPV